jgi:hypothetical protein
MQPPLRILARAGQGGSAVARRSPTGSHPSYLSSTARVLLAVAPSLAAVEHAYKTRVPATRLDLLIKTLPMRPRSCLRATKQNETEGDVVGVGRGFRGIVAVLFVVAAWCCAAWGQGFSITITVDENCNSLFTNTNGFSSPLDCTLAADPGPGGLTAALTYDLLNPPGLVAGDFILLDAPGAATSDVIRFNTSSPLSAGAGSLVFYSDLIGGANALADTGFPTAFYTNNLMSAEAVLPGGFIGIAYTPTLGQPGFVEGASGPVTYVIRSDVVAVVPESATMALFGAAVLALGWSRRRRS